MTATIAPDERIELARSSTKRNGKLLEIRFGTGDLPGSAFGSPGVNAPFHWDPRTWDDYDGVHLIAAHGGQRVLPRTWDDYTIHLSSTARRVKFTGFDFSAGTVGCIFAGRDGYATAESKPLLVEFEGCTFSDSVHGHVHKWGVMGYQASFIFTGCRFDLPNCREHAIYPHGFGEPGIYAVHDCRFEAVRSQAIKAVNRPHEDCWVEEHGYRPTGLPDLERGTPWVEDMLIWIKGNTIRNFGLPGNDRGGGGIVLEASGAESIVIEDNRITPGPDGSGIGVGIDDSGYRSPEGWHRGWSPAGVPGEGPANGSVRLDRNLIDLWNETKKPPLRIVSARHVYNRWNGLFVPTTKNSNIQSVESVQTVSCNHALIREIAAGEGMPNADRHHFIQYPSGVFTTATEDHAEGDLPEAA
jgi:hypothetical protein